MISRSSRHQPGARLLLLRRFDAEQVVLLGMASSKWTSTVVCSSVALYRPVSNTRSFLSPMVQATASRLPVQAPDIGVTVLLTAL